MVDAVRTSEMSVYFDETTRRYIPEGCHLLTRLRENLKSHHDKHVMIANNPLETGTGYSPD
jgi:hypothetical protein